MTISIYGEVNRQKKSTNYKNMLLMKMDDATKVNN